MTCLMLTRRPLACLLPLILGVALLALPGPAGAEDEQPKGEESKGGEGKQEAAAGNTSPLTAAQDDEAKTLAAAIKKIGKKKNATLVLPVLEKIDTLAHEAFDKVLLKLLKHESSLVALRVADMWEWRVRDKKVAGKLWKASWAEKKNNRRYSVKAKVLKAFARGGIPLNPKQYKEVERAWRWIVGNPNPQNVPALSAIADYARLAADKRLFRPLAEELDEPGTDSPNAPGNPPADWWKRRWELWKGSKPAVVEALKALTGKEFDKTAEAKAWCEQKGKEKGVAW